MDEYFSYLSSSISAGGYRYCTVMDIFKKKAKEHPEREILIHRSMDGSRETLTFKELEREATKLAKYLISKGIRKGDRIALFGPNTIEWVVGEFAIIMAGGVVVHVAINVTDAHDIWEIFAKADCRAFLIDPGKGEKFLDSIFYLLALFRKRRPSQHYQDTDSSNPTVVFMRDIDNDRTYANLQEVMKMDNLTAELPLLYPEDPILVFTTSGSTGKPKMVAHTHFDVVNMLPFNVFDDDQEKFYNDRPFGWAGGSPVSFIIRGQTRVFADSSVAVEGKSTEQIWEMIRSEKCTSAMLLPYFLNDLLSIKDSYDSSFKLKCIMTGGQIVDSSYSQVVGVFTDALLIGYGSTEAGCVSMGTPIFKDGILETGDVGKPVTDVEVKVIDDMGNVTPREQPGELCIRSRLLFQGYFMNQEVNKQVFLEGNWFRTGDTGCVTKDGRIMIKGRIKDVISRGTRKVMPGAIEDVLNQMPRIKHVVVVAVPDKRLYEEICACYVANDDAVVQPKDMEDFAKKHFLKETSVDGLGEIPKYYLCFDEFPILPTGKPNKRKIKIQAVARLNL